MKYKKWSLEKKLEILSFSEEIGGVDVLTPIKQEYYSKFRLLIKRLIFSLKLSVYPGSIFPWV